MLSLQEALDLDFSAASSSSCGARDMMGMDIITCGFTPWGPESCPTLDQVMASSGTAPARAEEDEAAGEDEEERLRRQRRKLSNRLSARRSRERKQQRLEELRAAAAGLRAEKQQLEARLHALARHGLAVVRCQNARLRAEAAALARRLREASRILALRRLAQALPPPIMPPLQQQAAGRRRRAGGAHDGARVAHDIGGPPSARSFGTDGRTHALARVMVNWPGRHIRYC